MLQVAIGGLAAMPTVGSVIAGATSADQIERQRGRRPVVSRPARTWQTLRSITGSDAAPRLRRMSAGARLVPRSGRPARAVPVLGRSCLVGDHQPRTRTRRRRRRVAR